jgi:hypothetical protein
VTPAPPGRAPGAVNAAAPSLLSPNTLRRPRSHRPRRPVHAATQPIPAAQRQAAINPLPDWSPLPPPSPTAPRRRCQGQPAPARRVASNSARLAANSGREPRWSGKGEIFLEPPLLAAQAPRAESQPFHRLSAPINGVWLLIAPPGTTASHLPSPIALHRAATRAAPTGSPPPPTIRLHSAP